ncbi:unnamed protein product [Rangifer tarandus platyrhynchus]|uniref:Uncharacterized protein n=1 Tax=Rangifer tarandus platyrhynchus TaxID=3082113 RepID=A0ABN8ZCC4_RANTA|nr:unnamed protein product [Rangifer tarandus platyrhynchus]
MASHLIQSFHCLQEPTPRSMLPLTKYPTGHLGHCVLDQWPCISSNASNFHFRVFTPAVLTASLFPRYLDGLSSLKFLLSESFPYYWVISALLCWFSNSKFLILFLLRGEA